MKKNQNHLLSQIIDHTGRYPIDVYIIEKKKVFSVQNRTVAVSETNKSSIRRTIIARLRLEPFLA
jgi:hypothetical protein